MKTDKLKLGLRVYLLAGMMSLLPNFIVAQDIDPTSNPEVKPYMEVEDSKYQLKWSEEFSGSEIDETKWEYRLDSKHWSTQLAKNNTVSDGLCNINLLKERSGDKEYTAGGIISKKYFGYGYYEAKIKCPSGAGWHTSFWMMDNHHKETDESKVELDPLETNSIDLYSYSTDYHQWRSDIGHMKRYQLVKTPDTPLDEFHVYGMEWTPDAAYFYFDGKLVKTATDLTEQLTAEEKAAGITPVKRNISETKKNDVQIWLTSIATWLGNTDAVDDSKLPASVQCDYIRFFAEKNTTAVKESMTSSSPKKFVYPNPSRETLNVVGFPRGNYIVSIFDLRGRKLICTSINASGGSIPIQIESLEKGMYVIELEGENEFVHLRFSVM